MECKIDDNYFLCCELKKMMYSAVNVCVRATSQKNRRCEPHCHELKLIKR